MLPIFLKHAGLLFLTTLMASGTYAIAQHANAPDAPCRDVGSGVEMTNCFAAEVGKSDGELNAEYASIQKVLSAARQEKLQGAQRLWIQFRDANCAAERQLYEGGSAASMVYSACIAAETRHRTADLETMYGWVKAK